VHTREKDARIEVKIIPVSAITDVKSIDIGAILTIRDYMRD